MKLYFRIVLLQVCLLGLTWSSFSQSSAVEHSTNLTFEGVSSQIGFLYSDFKKNDFGVGTEEDMSEARIGFSAQAHLNFGIRKSKHWSLTALFRYTVRPPSQVLTAVPEGNGTGQLLSTTIFGNVPTRKTDVGFQDGDFEFPNHHEFSLGALPKFDLNLGKGVKLSAAFGPMVTLVSVNELQVNAKAIPNQGFGSFITFSSPEEQFFLVKARKFRFEFNSTFGVEIPITNSLSVTASVSHILQITPIYKEDLAGFTSRTGIRSANAGEPKWLSFLGHVGFAHSFGK